MAIENFKEEYAFLSNFWPCAVSFEGDIYPSVEHAYVAAKTTDLELRLMIKATPTAGRVKRFGRGLVLRHNWDRMRIPVMRQLLLSKFGDPALKAKLLATGEQALIEGNTWGDRFWGVYLGSGENNLGKLLMERRSMLRTNSLF